VPRVVVFDLGDFALYPDQKETVFKKIFDLGREFFDCKNGSFRSFESFGESKGGNFFHEIYLPKGI